MVILWTIDCMNYTNVKYWQDRAHLQYGLIFRSLHLQKMCVAIPDIQEKMINNSNESIEETLSGQLH